MALGASVGAQETASDSIALETQQSHALTMGGATAAYSLDPGIADVLLEDGVPRIIGVAPGSTTIVVVTTEGMQYAQVVVRQRVDALLRNTGPPSARNGVFESQYDSFSRRLQNIVSVAMQRGGRVTTARLNYTLLPSESSGRARHIIPAASYRIVERDRELVLFDDPVRSSPLTVDGQIVRGVHARYRGLQLHAGYSSYAFFNNLLLSRERRAMFGIDYRHELGRRSALTPRLYVFPTRNASRGKDGVVASLGYEYGSDTALQVLAEAALSRGLDSGSPILPGGYLNVSRIGARDNLSLRALYQPDGFATLDGAVHGFRSDGIWLRKVTKRLSSSLALDANQFSLPGFQQTNRNLSLGLRYALRPEWILGSGGRYSYFGSRTSAQPPVTSYELPLGIEYTTQPFGGALEYRYTKSSVSEQAGNGIRASLRARSDSTSFDLYVDRSTQTPTLDLIFAENPGLELALREFGLRASTPAELARLLREYPELVNFGAIRGVNVNLSPVHYQAGSSLWWKGGGFRDARLGVTTSYTRDIFPSRTRESAFAALSYTFQLTHALGLGAHYSHFFTRGDANSAWTSSDGWQLSLRHQFNELPSLSRMFARRGTISGIVFEDPDETGEYRPGMIGIAGAEILLNGTTKAVTDRQGHFAFDRVVATDRHQVEVRYSSPKPFRFTSPPIASAGVDHPVAFGIGPIAGHLTVYVRTTEQLPVSKVRVSVSDGHRTLIRETGEGKASLELSRPGSYTVSLNAESVPAGYLLVDAEPRTVNVVEGIPAEVAFVLKANRSIAGTLKGRAAAPLPGVTVSLDGGPKASTTDARGNYLFRNVPPGPHVITAEIGGARLRKEIEVPVAPGVVRDVDLHADHAAVVARADRAAPAPTPTAVVAQAVVAQAVVAQAVVAQDEGAASPSAFLVQVGTFANPMNADALMRRLQSLGIPTLREHRGRFIVIDAGPFFSSTEAKQARAQLHRAGLEAQLRHPTPAVAAASAPPPVAEPDGEFVVQIGVFREKENAREAQRQAARVNLPTFTTVQRAFVVVQAGPFATRQKANDARQRLARNRIDGLVVRNSGAGKVRP